MRRFERFAGSVMAGVALGMVVLASAGWAQEQASSAPGEAETTNAVARLMRQAEILEQSGQTLKAAQTYEKIAKAQPSTRRVLANRLTRLYAEAGVTNKALQWAAVVTQVHPDAQAFLAGVHTLLKNYDEAAKIVRGEIEAAPSSQRRMLMLWQLGEIYEKQGKLEDGERAFQDALAAAANETERDAARKRLEKFQESRTERARRAPPGAAAPSGATNAAAAGAK